MLTVASPPPKAQPLEPRRRPSSASARKTVERILASTAALLDEVGFDDLTTNLIAERADLNVASVYKYFPNKYAVLMALAERLRDEQLELLARQLRPEGDWRTELAALLDAYVELYLQRPGFAELTAVMASSTPLREAEEASLAAETKMIAERMAAYGIQATASEREAMARVMLEAARGVFSLLPRSRPARRKRLMQELRRMLEAYLTNYIEPASRRRSG
jgi:AcrR family transcriptional regulator